MKDQLLTKIENRTARVAVIGMGYVGLPLAIEYAKAGFPVLGFDLDDKKIEAIRKGESYIKHIGNDAMQILGSSGRCDATADPQRLAEADAILICVPTPLNRHRDPDLRFIESTARTLSPVLREGQLVTLESTTYPGTTEEVLVPLLEEKSGLTAGKEFFVAYSPEREDPNNTQFSTSTIPKVVGGLGRADLEVARKLYDAVICETVPVSSCRTAEATKLMENIFRCINIALVNELKVVFSEMDIDVWEVIEAAKTKPFGYMPFYPGPGLGGHCIPIDPFYLSWKAREYDTTTRFIELAGEINTSMPDYVVQQSMLALNRHGKSLKNSRVLLVGLAYKKNVDDDRESPTYVLWKKLAEQGAEISYYDPYCPIVRPSREHADLAGIAGMKWDDIGPETVDLAIIATAHDNVDHDLLASRVPLVVDTRGTCKDAENILRA